MIDIKEKIKEPLQRYRSGETEALGELVELCRRPLYGYLLRMTEGRDDVDEIYQEVWLRAIRNLHRLRDQQLMSWLFRIAHNLIIDRARKRKPDCSLQDSIGDGQSREDQIAGPGLAPDRLSGAKDLGEQIRRALDRLPAPQREVFLMRMEGDLTFKEIARIQRVTLNTALGRMHYALGKLREDLLADFEDFARIDS